MHMPETMQLENLSLEILSQHYERICHCYEIVNHSDYHKIANHYLEIASLHNDIKVVDMDKIIQKRFFRVTF